MVRLKKKLVSTYRWKTLSENGVIPWARRAIENKIDWVGIFF